MFTLVGGGTRTWTLPCITASGSSAAREGSLLYAGFLSHVAFTSVVFNGTSSDDIFGFDDVTIGSEGQVLPP